MRDVRAVAGEQSDEVPAGESLDERVLLCECWRHAELELGDEVVRGGEEGALKPT